VVLDISRRVVDPPDPMQLNGGGLQIAPFGMMQQQQPLDPRDIERNRLAQLKISTVAVPIAKLNKMRLAEAVSHVVELDCAITADLDQVTLSVLIWVFTRIRPNIMVSELRSITYLDLYNTMKLAGDRVRKNDESQYNEILDMFKAENNLSKNLVMRAAIKLGFDPDWLDKAKKRSREDAEETKAAMQARLASPNNILTSCKHYHLKKRSQTQQHPTPPHPNAPVKPPQRHYIIAAAPFPNARQPFQHRTALKATRSIYDTKKA
jgi:hypothetical protein